MLHTFMNVDIELGAGVLVPRHETELLGNTALELVSDLASPIIVDMCCGSGNLALAIAAARPDARIYASDLTDDCVLVARHNVERFGLEGRVTIVQGDMFSGLASFELLARVDLIVCNPPYISTGKLDTDSAHLLETEPREAFDAGPYGIALHQRLIADAAPFLRSGGWLAFEFGAGQHRQAKALLSRARAYREVQFFNNAEDVPRVAVVRKQ